MRTRTYIAGTRSPCGLVQGGVGEAAQQAVGLIEGGWCHWRRQLGGVEEMVAKAGFVVADQRGEGEKEKATDDQKRVPAVVEERRGLGLCELEL